jgi:hypothetical protein
VNGFPILACIFNRSLYTTISAEVAEELGLRKIERLRSRKFVASNGGKMRDQTQITCLEPIVIGIGDIHVKLRNAVEYAPYNGDKDENCGVQLGTDFLRSARWCPIDFETRDGNYMRSTDGESIHLLSSPSKNMLRFYSHDGKVAHVPLLPFGSHKGETNYLLSVKDTTKFDQCMWCNRMFPEGMLACGLCQQAGKLATYCDERCQLAAHKCHKRFH